MSWIGWFLGDNRHDILNLLNMFALRQNNWNRLNRLSYRQTTPVKHRAQPHAHTIDVHTGFVA